jgi:alkylated DNA repair dioxygenase AlkB
MFGKRVRVPRLTAWHGDTEASYRYSGVTNRPAVWTPLLSDLRAEVEQQTGARFNSVLLNYYRDGSDHVSWHADDEPELGAQPTIASVSLGSERRFALRTIATPRHTVGLTLNSGSLLVMSGATQEEWQHCVRKETRAVGPRVNLTFRLVS